MKELPGQRNGKKRTFAHWDSFLVTPAAGNFRGNQTNPEGLAARIYPGLGIARFASALSIVTDADPSFGFTSNAGLWQPTVSDPPLIATADEIARLRAAIEHDGLEQIGRADNVVITGSTAPGNTFVDLLESFFSNGDPNVVAVGESITTLGPVTQGTSFAAPQVAGLASYLWLLSDDLRNNQANRGHPAGDRRKHARNAARRAGDNETRMQPYCPWMRLRFPHPPAHRFAWPFSTSTTMDGSTNGTSPRFSDCFWTATAIPCSPPRATISAST